MPEVEIRPAVATDLPILVAIEHAVASEYVWQLDLHKDNNQVEIRFREVRLPRAVTVQYHRPPGLLVDEWNRQAGVLVAVLAGIPVGYVRVNDQIASAIAWITDLAVERSYRRQGIASALVLGAQNWALSKGLRRGIIEMPSKNFPAINLALKLGYEFCGYNDQYYASQDVTLFFGRALK